MFEDKKIKCMQGADNQQEELVINDFIPSF
ncbi:MAG: hypothetical protein ACJATI_003875 [Halioglobus sp.]